MGSPALVAPCGWTCRFWRSIFFELRMFTFPQRQQIQFQSLYRKKIFQNFLFRILGLTKWRCRYGKVSPAGIARETLNLNFILSLQQWEIGVKPDRCICPD